VEPGGLPSCDDFDPKCLLRFCRHVHEKAILMVTVPLALLTNSSPGEAKNYFVLSTVATFSLFPLIFSPEEKLLKVLLLACQILVTHLVLKQHNGREANWKLSW